MKVIIYLLVVAVAIAGPLMKRQARTNYALPDGAELIVGTISSSFSCDSQLYDYGYFADVENKCKIFHICAPSNNGRKSKIYSFFCGNQTVFDQEHLVCKNPEFALPCDQAPTKYSVNENFGKKTGVVTLLRWGLS